MQITIYSEAVGIWQSAMKDLKQKISPDELTEWFSPINPVSFESGSLIISVPSKEWMNQIEKKYIGVLSGILKSIAGPRVNLLYKFGETKMERRKPIENTILAPSSITCRNVLKDSGMIIQSVLAAKATYPSGEISNTLMLAISEALMPYLTNDDSVFTSTSFLSGNFPVTFDTADVKSLSGVPQNKTQIIDMVRNFMNRSEINFRFSYEEGKLKVKEQWLKIITAVEDVRDTTKFKIYINKDIIPYWLFINPQLNAPSIKINKQIGYSFTGKYTLKLYNVFLDQMQNDSENDFLIEKKELLEILGIKSSDRYAAPSLLGERILKPAIKEMERWADLSASWTFLSQNGIEVPKGINNIRQTKVRFHITQMTQEQKDFRFISEWLKKHHASPSVISEFDQIILNPGIRSNVIKDMQGLDKKQGENSTLWPSKKKLNCLVTNFLTKDRLF